MKDSRTSPRRSGFTLVELLVVVLILGILTALALPSYISSVQTSQLKTASANARAIAAAVQSDYVRNGGDTYERYTRTGIVGTANLMADLGGTIPTNPCSSGVGINGYSVTATSTKWTIFARSDLCPNGGRQPEFTLGN